MTHATRNGASSANGVIERLPLPQSNTRTPVQDRYRLAALVLVIIALAPLIIAALSRSAPSGRDLGIVLGIAVFAFICERMAKPSKPVLQ